MDEVSNSPEITPSTLSELVKTRAARKKQVAQEQRVDDILKIANRGNDEGTSPLNLFPREIWEYCLKYLTEPTDLLHVYNTCPLFRDILEPRRIRDILFPFVLHLDTLSKYLRNDIPLNHKTRFNDLRPVCRSLRRAVAHNHLRAIEVQDTQLSSQNEVEAIVVEVGGEQSDIEDAIRVIRRMKDNLETLPIRALSLELYHDLSETLEPFSTAFADLLESHGSQLLSFTYVNALNVDEITEDLKALNLWLRRMPNLENLILKEVFDKRVPNYLQDNHFPHLKQLKLLRVYFHGEGEFAQGDPLEEPFPLEAILERNLQVTRLFLDCMVAESHDALVLLAGRPQFRDLLSRLNLEMFRVSSLTSKLETIQELFWGGWRALTKIEIELSRTIVLRSALFGILEQFQGLEEVDLTLYQWQEEKDESTHPGFLHLPRLTKFKLRLMNPNICRDLSCLKIDFLIPCGNLKELGMRHCATKESCLRHFGEGGSELVQFQGGWANFEESNVWKVFPSLKEVRVGEWGGRCHKRP